MYTCMYMYTCIKVCNNVYSLYTLYNLYVHVGAHVHVHIIYKYHYKWYASTESTNGPQITGYEYPVCIYVYSAVHVHLLCN